MNRKMVARELISIAKILAADMPLESAKMAGRSYSVRFVIRVNQVFSGIITTDAEWKSMYGRPTPQNIKRYVEKYNESLEPGGANSHIGRRGAIFGGVIIDWSTNDVVAEWTDRNIIRFYTSKPAFEVVAGRRRADKFETLPKGWTEESLKDFYKNLAGTGDAKAKFYRCVDKIKGTDITDPNSFCAALLDRFMDPSWRGVGR